jgi:hypothetical protein
VRADNQVAADPAITLMKSRCRIASPKAWDYFDLAFNTAITAGNRERQNGFGGLFAQQQLRAAKCRYGSIASFWALWPDVGYWPDSDRIGYLRKRSRGVRTGQSASRRLIQ